MDVYARARELIDAAHAADFRLTPDGRAVELVYADRMESWVTRMAANAPQILRLAARCQHLERWKVPRSNYPEGRAGYFAWRRGLYVTQAERARGMLLAAGVTPSEADQAAAWIAKKDLGSDAGTQALEDAACLVFLENEIAHFAEVHAEYPREKFIGILQKTWRKMSPAARDVALSLDLPTPIATLVREATSEPPPP